MKRDDKFQIHLQLPISFEHLSGIVEPPEALQNPHYSVKGNVDKDSYYDSDN